MNLAAAIAAIESRFSVVADPDAHPSDYWRSVGYHYSFDDNTVSDSEAFFHMLGALEAATAGENGAKMYWRFRPELTHSELPDGRRAKELCCRFRYIPIEEITSCP